VDRWDHPVDHLFPKDFVVPIIVDAMDLQLLVANQKFYWNKSHEVLQLVAVDMEVWPTLEVLVKDPIQT